jgi:hypothetical protein
MRLPRHSAFSLDAALTRHFRNAMADEWMGYDDNTFIEQEWHTETLTKLEYYESVYRRLKEATSILELALWKIKLDNSKDHHGNAMSGGNKKMKIDLSEFRLQCQVRCGADYVIGNVLPYLLPCDYARSHQYVPLSRLIYEHAGW